MKRALVVAGIVIALAIVFGLLGVSVPSLLSQKDDLSVGLGVLLSIGLLILAAIGVDIAIVKGYRAYKASKDSGDKPKLVN